MSWADLVSAILLAEDAAPAENPSPWGGIVSMLPFILLLPVFFLLIQRPQRREQAARQEMLKNLKKNDHVMTSGGIYGVVTNVRSDSDEVTVRIDDNNNTRMRMSRSAIAQIITSSAADADEAK